MTPPPEVLRRAARWATAALVLAILCALAFALAFVRDASIHVQGLLLAGAFAGLAVALGVIGQRLVPADHVVEDWSPTATETHERELLAATLKERGMGIRRRSLLFALLGGAAAAVGGALLLPVRALGPRPGRALFRTAWSPGARLVNEKGQPVRVDDLAVGGFVTAWPENAPSAADSHVVLIRTRPGDLRTPPGREGWAPDGYVAYSKTCTHAGCPVGLYDQRTQRLFCPCEQAVFDVTDGARPIAGPAPRSLPQLPLFVDGEGFLRAQADFDEPVGPGFWERGG